MVWIMHIYWISWDDRSNVVKYPVKNDIDGLIASVNDGSTSAFMWEWFTTKPYTEKGGQDNAGEVRFVRSIPSSFCCSHHYHHSLYRLAQCQLLGLPGSSQPIPPPTVRLLTS
jgi:hypothetical protein